MTQPVSRLVVQIGANVGGLISGGRQAERSIDGVGKRAARATKQMAALGTAAAVAGSAALFTMAKHAISVADEIAKTARAIGVTSEALQELRFAAGRSGIEMKAFDGALMAFSKRVGEARAGTGTLVTILEKMSPALLEQVKAAGSVEEAFALIVEAASRLGNEMDRNALLAAAFGRTAGVQMANLVQGGSKAVDELRGKARELGIVISNEMAADAEKAADKLGDMGDVLKVAGLNIALRFMPVMESLAALFTSQEFLNGIGRISGALDDAITWMSNNTETVQRFAGAWAGIAALGRFGPMGALTGAAAGAALGPQIFNDMLGGDQHALSLEQGGINIGDMSAANEKLGEHLQERAEMWSGHLSTLSEMTAQAHAAAAAAESGHQAKLTDIAKGSAKDRAEVERREMFGRLNASANFFGDLASLAEAAGDDAFKQQKMLAIAAALVGSIESATHAFNWGTKIGGPVLGAAFAAAATAAQVARVAQIKSVQPGGGGTASGGAGSFSAPATPAQAVNSQQTLIVQGIDETSLWRGDNVRNLAERLIEYQENGGKVVLQ